MMKHLLRTCLLCCDFLSIAPLFIDILLVKACYVLVFAGCLFGFLFGCVFMRVFSGRLLAVLSKMQKATLV